MKPSDLVSIALDLLLIGVFWFAVDAGTARWVLFGLMVMMLCLDVWCAVQGRSGRPAA